MYSRSAPAAVNLSDTQPRQMWVLAGLTNQGDYGDQIEFSLDIYLSPPAGCWRSPIGLVLPGSESHYLFSGEERFAVYRLFYECHAPATPQYFDQVVSFRADLASGNEPADAKGNNTKATNKTIIVDSW